MAEWLKAAVSKTVGGSRPPQVRILSSPPSLVNLIAGEMSELAEGARLEIVCTAKSGTEGSNPSLSAINKKMPKVI